MNRSENTWLRWRRRALVAALALCAGSALAQSPVPSAESRNLSAEMFFRLMVADVAMQRGEPALAAREFLAIATETRDARVAERATEAALAARNYNVAAQSVRLWLEIEPSSDRAKRVQSALQATLGPLPDIKEHLARIIADPDNKGANTAEGLLQLNRMLSSQQDKPGVYKLIVEIAQPYLHLPEAHVAIATAGLGTGLKDAAIARDSLAAVDRALALRPGLERAAILKAQILSADAPAKALAWLREFAQAHPKAKTARTALAQYLVDQRQYQEARSEFGRLLAEDPAAHDARFAVAMVSMQMRDYAVAEEHLLALKDSDYGEPGVILAQLGQVAEETKRYEQAIERFREVPQGDRWWYAQLRIGALLGRVGKLDEGRSYLAALAPGDKEQTIQVRQTEAQLLRDAGRHADAFELLDKALVTFPENKDLMYDLAMVAEKIDRIDVAEKNLRRLVELQPESAHALNALGYTLVDRTDRLQEGLALIEKAHKLSPHDPFILDSVGWAHFRLGNLTESENFLRRALSERADPEIAAHLGEVLWARGQREQAREIWRTHLKDAPDHPVLLETIKRLER